MPKPPPALIDPPEARCLRVERLPCCTMSDDQEPIGYRWVKDTTLIDFEIVNEEIQPTPGNDDTAVEIELQLEEDLVETCALGFMFAICVLSFHDGRPRGVSGHWYEDEDDLKVDDFLTNLAYRSGRLHVHLDYIRGRCLKTTVELSPDGKLLVRTFGRGEAATRWLATIKGKKFLRPVP